MIPYSSVHYRQQLDLSLSHAINSVSFSTNIGHCTLEEPLRWSGSEIASHHKSRTLLLSKLKLPLSTDCEHACSNFTASSAGIMESKEWCCMLGSYLLYRTDWGWMSNVKKATECVYFPKGGSLFKSIKSGGVFCHMSLQLTVGYPAVELWPH